MNLRGCAIVAVTLGLCWTSTAAAGREWFAAERGNLRVISNDSAAMADAVLADAERFEAAMEHAARVRADRPVRVFALNGADSVAEVAPSSLRRSDLRTFGFSQSGPHTAFVVIRADRPRPALLATLRHELVHVMVESQGGDVPAWLDEGLAEFWGSLVVEGDRVIVGRAIDAHVKQLRRGRWLPLDKFTERRRGSLPSNSGDVSQFYAQSWAMVHFLLLGPTGGNLAGWFPASSTLPPDFDIRVRRYISEATWPTVSLPWHQQEEQRNLAEQLSDARAMAERAAVLVFGQRPKAALPLARRSLEIANEPLALETIGAYYFLNNEADRARDWLTRSRAAGETSYTAAIYLSVLAASAAERERYLVEALRIRPGSEVAWEHLGQIYRSDGRFALMRRWCRARAVVPVFQWLPLAACGI